MFLEAMDVDIVQKPEINNETNNKDQNV